MIQSKCGFVIQECSTATLGCAGGNPAKVNFVGQIFHYNTLCSTVMLNTPHPEPWLRGRKEDLPAVHLAVLNALELTSEIVDHWCFGLTQDDFHAQPHGLPSVAFHIRHIARSVDRLLTYAEDNQLSDAQVAALKTESEPTASVRTILDEFHKSLDHAAARIRNLAGADLELPRAVGRQQLPTTVGGLLVHIADHTQRHTGQIITTAKLLRSFRSRQAILLR